MLSDKERKVLIELISNEQIHMIIKHPDRYGTHKYTFLEELKVKIKEMGDGYEE